MDQSVAESNILNLIFYVPKNNKIYELIIFFTFINQL